MNQMLTREPIRLSTRQPQLRRQEWRPWKKLGFRVLGEDGLTVHHERDAICQKVLAAIDGVDADLFLFGSQAQGTASERSDYDIGYWLQKKSRRVYWRVWPSSWKNGRFHRGSTWSTFLWCLILL